MLSAKKHTALRGMGPAEAVGLSTAPTAHQIERGRESAKGRKGNLDKDIEGTLNMPRGEGLCRGRRRSKAGQESR